MQTIRTDPDFFSKGEAAFIRDTLRMLTDNDKVILMAGPDIADIYIQFGPDNFETRNRFLRLGITFAFSLPSLTRMGHLVRKAAQEERDRPRGTSLLRENEDPASARENQRIYDGNKERLAKTSDAEPYFYKEERTSSGQRFHIRHRAEPHVRVHDPIHESEAIAVTTCLNQAHIRGYKAAAMVVCAFGENMSIL